MVFLSSLPVRACQSSHRSSRHGVGEDVLPHRDVHHGASSRAPTAASIVVNVLIVLGIVIGQVCPCQASRFRIMQQPPRADPSIWQSPCARLGHMYGQELFTMACKGAERVLRIC